MLFAMFNADASFTGFHGISLVLLAAGILLAVAWLLVFAARYYATFPRLPDADAATNELRSEPPAIVNLLVNRWKPTQVAMAATLLDLAARKVFDIQQLDGDHFVIHIERVPADESSLAPYERQMLDWVRSRATGGSAPFEALTLGEEHEANSWWKRFSKSVADDARRLGLARSRWASEDWTLLGGLLAACFAALGLALAAAHVGGGSSSSGDDNFNPLDWLFIAFFGWGVVMAWLRSLRALRDTEAGRVACAHWLGVRQYLRDTHAFDELPPAAVVLWERYLSYGAAVGAAHDAVHVLPFSVEEPGTAWSRKTGTWRQLRIEYPTRFGFGESPAKVFLGGVVRVLFWGALAFVALPVVTKIAFDVISDVLTTEQRDNAWLYIVLGLALFVIAAGAYLVVRFLAGVIRTVRGARDLGKQVTVEGPIVKLHNGRAAVDDGTSEELVAWFPPPGGPALVRGMDVRVTMSPHLHHVSAVTVLSTTGTQSPGPAAVSAPSQSVITGIDAATVRELTGLDLAPTSADSTQGYEAYLGAGATAVAFSDSKNLVVVARAADEGRASTLFSALGRIPGFHAQPVPGLAGESSWIGDRMLLTKNPSGITAVIVSLPGGDAARRLEIAQELVRRAGAESPAPMASVAPSPPTPA